MWSARRPEGSGQGEGFDPPVGRRRKVRGDAETGHLGQRHAAVSEGREGSSERLAEGIRIDVDFE